MDLSICDGECKSETKDGVRVLTNPVKDAEKTIKVEVSMGNTAPLALAVEPRYNQPGKYNGYFMPSKVGAYTFHVFGTIGSDKLDEKFTSSDKTFGEAEQLTTYPATDGKAVAATNTANYDAQIKEAKDSASSATTFGIIGIVVGVLGLAVVAFALLRRPAASNPATTTTNPAANRG